MTSLLPFFSRLFKVSVVAAILSGTQNSLQAVAPTAPAITRVDFSVAGFLANSNGVQYDANGVPQVDVSGNTHSYVVRWKDNSLDEEGFQLEVRVGATSPFQMIARLAANVQETLLSPLNGLPAATVVEFRVVAWKFNGAAVESSTSAIFPFTVPEATVTLAAPSGLTATNVNDSTIKLAWTDAATSELYYQILFREVRVPAISYRHLGFTNLSSNNPTEQTMRLRLAPSTAYEFKVRGTRQAPQGTTPLITLATTGESLSTTLTTSVLSPPAQLSAEAVSEDLIRLKWRDISTNETGYEIQYRLTSDPDPEAF
ncbi:MAG: fibronectin type III domain-containing protein, partial [Prosthecobacter sp.]